MTNTQKLQQLILNETVIDYNELVDLADKAVKDEQIMLNSLKEINSLCDDYSNNEEGFINVGQIAKISINAIKQATE
jgi:hypothetical protein